ncbi:HD domain-containing protein [Clostridium botulinum]|uniref:HD domain-containing protein n=2 Tax=Clostridium botulinum TaxID=1491 RepID=A0A6G4EK90_CLOBO|nr:HD domain-containing protein [Clostridium botulinum]APH18660.1 HDIG domain protein [Clostridium botulinum]AUM89769.1 phosphohydrolase [Clostridium botulinum]NFB15495.1 HD domain-containing protein [Clostridium botulinum]NFH59812.1 HD domain-containing protein [Clostridium botulinum]NFH63671.1 HD domain-containing protein [Clostridium botulinum]
MEYEDIVYINMHLDNEELKIFNKLSISEQKHSIKVAYDIEKLYEKGKYNLTKDEFIKVALLHDIGKLNYKVDIIKKSIIVIMDRITNSRIKKFQNIKSVYVYYNHPYLGYCILKQYNKYSEKMLYLIKNHHNENIINKDLSLLIYSDNLN